MIYSKQCVHEHTTPYTCTFISALLYNTLAIRFSIWEQKELISGQKTSFARKKGHKIVLPCQTFILRMYNGWKVDLSKRPSPVSGKVLFSPLGSNAHNSYIFMNEYCVLSILVPVRV